MKKFLVFLSTIIILPVFAYEDCLVITNGKLTDIKIEDNSIIDVYPIITIMNDKNTLVIHPLKTGSTRFCALKDNKEIVVFNVEIDEIETNVSENTGFEVLSIDVPPDIIPFSLDLPPMMR